MRKKKILHVTEASFLKTGYSTYSHELLKRLYKTGKYEIAELGCFARPDDPAIAQIPWKFYANLPDENKADEVNYYNSNKLHSFGSWKFEQTLLDFMPDIVFDIRDNWMHEYQEKSPFRKYYHWTLMPTVDASPQNPGWLSTYMNADSVFSYSDWGLDILNKSGVVNTVGSAPPGADINTFKPLGNKNNIKKNFGLPTDSFIIGTVMRNQKRKLYPDLIKSFAKFLDVASLQVSQKSYLYLHTSYPDWWDIPTLILDAGIGHKCILTYRCRSCGHVFASVFSDARTICQKCKRSDAFLPNTHNALERSDLAYLLNCFDVYVQYANSEGFGMPQVEAASCGVPVFAVDYSAMSDVVRKIEGTPIKVLCLQKEAETGCDRAIPDNDDFVMKLSKFAELPDAIKIKNGMKARKAVEKYYDWDNTAKIWENHFDSVELKDLETTWYSPVKQHNHNIEIPKNLPAEQFAQYLLINVAGRPDLCNHYIGLKLARDIQWMSTVEQLGDLMFNDMSILGIRPNRKDFTRDDAIKEVKNLCEYFNFWERKRAEKINK